MTRWSGVENLLGGTERFRRNFLWIASAHLVAQLIGLISLPIISRLYAPEAFGVLTAYTLVQSLVNSVAFARVDWVIPNSRTSHTAERMIALGVTLGSTTALLFLAGAFLAPEPINRFLGVSPDSNVMLLLALGILSGSCQLIGQSWYILRGDLTLIGWAKLAQAVITLTLALVFGIMGGGGTALVAAYVTGFVAADLVLFIWGDAPVQRTHFSARKLRRVIYFHGKRLASGTALSLVNMMMTVCIAALLVVFYSKEIVGWYGLIFRVASAPIGLLTIALIHSFWSDAAIMAKSDPQSLKNFYIGSIKRLSMVAIPLGAIFLMGPFYVPAIFGPEKWSGAGELLAALTPYLVGTIVFGPTTHLIVYGKGHWQLASDLVTLVLTALAFAFVAQAGHPAWLAITVSSTVVLIGYGARFWLHLLANKYQITKVARRNRGSALYCRQD